LIVRRGRPPTIYVNNDIPSLGRGNEESIRERGEGAWELLRKKGGRKKIFPPPRKKVWVQQPSGVAVKGKRRGAHNPLPGGDFVGRDCVEGKRRKKERILLLPAERGSPQG